MKRYAKQKITLKITLAASCIGIMLWGCGGDEKKANELVIEPIISEEDEQTISEETQTVSEEPPETVSDSQTLYEQFLNDSISATVSSDYFFGGYAEQLLGKNTSLTLTELNNSISNFYFDSAYTDKSSCDSIQYAYVSCPDSADENEKNLLVKFMGLDIYTQDDNSYTVIILTENNNQLYITGWYECWARSETTAYENGILSGFGSSGAGDHGADLSAILSDGKVAPIYNAEILSGQWTSYVNESIYNDVIDENTVPPNLIVSVYTIGDKKYYQYDMSECGEEEKPLCEEYIDRCRDEAGINWVSEEEIRTAIQNQCTAVGMDYSTADQWEEATWNELSLPSKDL